MAILQTRDVGVRFGDFHAVSDVSLTVTQGQIHSVIGPNGAGKTTLFNSLSGVRPPTSGTVLLEGVDVTRRPAWARVSLGMARSFQITNIFQDLTVFENLRIAVQAARGGRGWIFWRSVGRDADILEASEALALQCGLADRGTARAGDLSHGGQRALEIGMALACDPKVLLLDEPLAGMGIDDVQRTRQLIHALVPQRTVLLVEHNMSVVLGISDTITVLAQGRVIAEGPPEVIRADPAVRDAYLGASA